MVSDRSKVIEDAIRDLDDYLMLFPDRMQAREVRDRVSALVQGGRAILPRRGFANVCLGRGDRLKLLINVSSMATI